MEVVNITKQHDNNASNNNLVNTSCNCSCMITDELVTEITEIIEKSDFVTVDTELTGLNEIGNIFFDTPELRYKHLRDKSMRYTITQFGLCAFTYDKMSKNFKCAPINFHVVPRSDHRNGFDFLINTSTVEFLNKHSFDFNKSLREGIPFDRLSFLKARDDNKEQKRKHNLAKLDDLNVENYDCKSIQTQIDECLEMLKDDSKSEIKIKVPASNLESYLIQHVLWKKLNVNGKSIYATFERGLNGTENCIKVLKTETPKEDMTAAINKDFAKESTSLDTSKLFGRIISAVVNKDTTIVGHNCFLDLLHIYDKFVDNLPDDLEHMAKCVHENFARWFDTKYIFHNSALCKNKDLVCSNNLQKLYEALTTEIYKKSKYEAHSAVFPLDFSDKFHTAYFDAYVTGVVFVEILNNTLEDPEKLWTNFKENAQECIGKLKNKFNLVNCETRILDLDINFSKQKTSDKKHIFHLTMPEYWNTNDVIACVANNNGASIEQLYRAMTIKWLNNTSLMFKVDTKIFKAKIPEGSLGTGVYIKNFYDFYGIPSPFENNDGFQVPKRRRR